MILGDVEETVTTVEIDEETYEEIYKVTVCIHIWFEVSYVVFTHVFDSKTLYYVVLLHSYF